MSRMVTWSLTHGSESAKPGSMPPIVASQVVMPSPTTAATSVEESDFESEAIWKTVSGVIGSGLPKLAHAEAPFVDHLVGVDHCHRRARDASLCHAVLDQAVEAIQCGLDLGGRDLRVTGRGGRCLVRCSSSLRQRDRCRAGECRLHGPPPGSPESHRIPLRMNRLARVVVSPCLYCIESSLPSATDRRR